MDSIIIKKRFFRNLLKGLLLLALPIWPCFNDLGNLPLRIWDEARQAQNAYEMYYNHQYWIPTFNGLPDVFGTKPSVFIVLEVISMKFFGINEFALRFPAAASAYLLGIAMMFFVWFYFKRFNTALISGILLFGSQALIRNHVARTADYDAPVAAFGVMAALSFFIFLHENKKVFWYLTCLLFFLAVSMKGIAGLLLVPPLFLYAFSQKKLLQLLKSKHTFLGFAVFLFLTIAYYGVRNYYQPGYVALVYKAEICSLYFNTVQGHSEGFWFYAINFYSKWFSNYWWILPLGLASVFMTRNFMVRKVGIFSAFMMAGYFLIISNSATKLFWYDSQMYVFVIVICATFFYWIIEMMESSDYRKVYSMAMTYAILLSLGLLGCIAVKDIIIDPQESANEKYFYTMANFLQQSNKANRNLDGYKILSGDLYVPHHTFYIQQLEKKGQRVEAVVFSQLIPGDSVMVSETNMNTLIQEKFNAVLLSNDYNIFAYRLDSLKNNDAAK